MTPLQLAAEINGSDCNIIGMQAKPVAGPAGAAAADGLTCRLLLPVVAIIVAVRCDCFDAQQQQHEHHHQHAAVHQQAATGGQVPDPWCGAMPCMGADDLASSLTVGRSTYT